MEPSRYQQLKTYLPSYTIPCTFTTQQRRSLQAQSKFFEVKRGLVYKKDKHRKNRLLRVIQKYEVEPVVFLTHTHPLGGHLGKDIMFNKIRNKYYWPQMYEDIRDYVKTCDACQGQGRNLAKPPLYPIPV